MEEKDIKLIQEALDEKMKGMASGEDVTKLEAQIADLAEKGIKPETMAKMQEQLDAIEIKSRTPSNPHEVKMGMLKDLRENELIKAIASGEKKSGVTVLPWTISQLKAVGTMTITGSTTDAVPEDWQYPVLKEPYRRVRVRTLIPVGPTSSDTVRYTRKENKEGSIGMVAEGAVKPQIDWEYNAYDAAVEQVAGWLRLSTRMLNDLDYLMGELTQDLPEELRDVEDTQLLTGNGVSPNLSGLITNATAFNGGGLSLAGANYYDVLSAAITQILLVNHQPTAILLNPSDAAQMRITKATTGEYVFPRNEPMMVDGVPIVISTAMTQGSFLVGDFARGAKIFEREGIKVEFFEQDGDNVKYNLVTVRVEERLALATKFALAFVTDTFAAAIVTLTPTTTTTTTAAATTTTTAAQTTTTTAAATTTTTAAPTTTTTGA